MTPSPSQNKMPRITDFVFRSEEITPETNEELWGAVSRETRNHLHLAFHDCLFSCDVLQDLLLRMHDTPRIYAIVFDNPGPVEGGRRQDLEQIFNDLFLYDEKAKYRDSLRILWLAGFRDLALTNRSQELLPNLIGLSLNRCDWVDPLTARGLTCSVEEITLFGLPNPNTVRSLLQNCYSSPRLVYLELGRVNLSAMSAKDYLPFLWRFRNGFGMTLTIYGDCSLRLENVEMLLKLVGTRSILPNFEIDVSGMPFLIYRPMVIDCVRRTDSLCDFVVNSKNLKGFVRLARERREKVVKRVIEELFECDHLANVVREFLGIPPSQ